MNLVHGRLCNMLHVENKIFLKKRILKEERNMLRVAISIVDVIDKLCTQIGKVFCLPWELNLLLPCFGLSSLHSRIYWNRWPSLPA